MATIPIGFELATQLASSTVKFNPWSHFDWRVQLVILDSAGDVQTVIIPLDIVPTLATQTIKEIHTIFNQIFIGTYLWEQNTVQNTYR